jgi:hypothetical protein
MPKRRRSTLYRVTFYGPQQLRTLDQALRVEDQVKVPTRGNRTKSIVSSRNKVPTTTRACIFFDSTGDHSRRHRSIGSPTLPEDLNLWDSELSKIAKTRKRSTCLLQSQEWLQSLAWVSLTHHLQSSILEIDSCVSLLHWIAWRPCSNLEKWGWYDTVHFCAWKPERIPNIGFSQECSKLVVTPSYKVQHWVHA